MEARGRGQTRAKAGAGLSHSAKEAEEAGLARRTRKKDSPAHSGIEHQAPCTLRSEGASPRGSR